MNVPSKFYSIRVFLFTFILLLGLGFLSSTLADDGDSTEGDDADKTVRLPSYAQAPIEMDEVVVVGKRRLREEDLIGEYRQPRWTATPRFLSTAVYVVPAGTFELDIWNDWKFDMDEDEDIGPLFNTTYELEMGISHRLQFDFYFGTEKIGWDGPLEITEQGFELRYAFADWGKIWGNPAIYLDYLNRNMERPEAEIKLLLGGEMTSRWHWGSNLIFERELSPEEAEQEYMATFAVSYTVIDEKFSVGLEVKGVTEDEVGEADEDDEEEGETEAEEEEEEEGLFTFNEYSVLAGPSVQWKPVPPMYITLTAFFGVQHEGEEEGEGEEEESENIMIFNPMLVAGWEF